LVIYVVTETPSSSFLTASYPIKILEQARLTVEVKNAWIYTSTPPIRLHGVVLS